ncbi:MAG: DUF3833 family protein [Pseudomonadota bacterium]
MTTTLVFLAGMVVMSALLWAMARYLTGFQAQKTSDYPTGRPFDIREHLDGRMVCEGVLYGPLGRVVTRFVADFEGTWEGNKGRLRESFRYDSGSTQDREWTLTTHNDGTFDALASDLAGPGTGVMDGSAVRLSYRIKLPESGGGHELDATDWMYLLDNGTIVNRSQLSKFGIKVAELVATIRKVDA